jgi:hypothetical protein
LFPIYN